MRSNPRSILPAAQERTIPAAGFSLPKYKPNMTQSERQIARFRREMKRAYEQSAHYSFLRESGYFK